MDRPKAKNNNNYDNTNMKPNEYKKLIMEAGYNPTPELVKEVKAEHIKLLTPQLVDGVFKRLYRQRNTGGQTPEPEK